MKFKFGLRADYKEGIIGWMAEGTHVTRRMARRKPSRSSIVVVRKPQAVVYEYRHAIVR